MGLLSVLAKRQSFEDQLKRLQYIMTGTVAGEDERENMAAFLRGANDECIRRGYSTVERFKAVEGVFAFNMWTYQHRTYPSAGQCRAAGVPEWYLVWLTAKLGEAPLAK